MIDTSAAEQKLIGTIQTIIAKATSPEQTPTLRPAQVVFNWLGGGQDLALDGMDTLQTEIPFPCRIVWVHLYAMDDADPPAPVTVSTTIGIRLTNYATNGSGSPLYGTGAAPAIASNSEADADLTGWVVNLSLGDKLIARPTAFSGAGARSLAMCIQLRPTDVPLRSDVTDGGEMLTASDGSLITLY